MATAITTSRNLGVDPILVIETNPRLRPTTKKQYVKAINKYLEAGNNLADSEALATYSQGLKSSSRSFLKAAVKLWTNHVEKNLKGQATPENVAAIQASIYRLESLNDAIEANQQKGQKAHTWLTQAEVKRLDGLFDDSLQGQRDRLTIGLLAGAGLRREELANLCFENVLEQPVSGRNRVVLQVRGKGAKERVIPISERLSGAIKAWGATIDSHEGKIIRSVNGQVGESITSAAIFNLVRKAGRAIGKPKLAPHDLRRTYAQLGYEAGIPITQISKLLGHSSVATTQRYLNLDLNLETTISDFIPVYN